MSIKIKNVAAELVEQADLIIVDHESHVSYLRNRMGFDPRARFDREGMFGVVLLHGPHVRVILAKSSDVDLVPSRDEWKEEAARILKTRSNRSKLVARLAAYLEGAFESGREAEQMACSIMPKRLSAKEWRAARDGCEKCAGNGCGSTEGDQSKPCAVMAAERR